MQDLVHRAQALAERLHTLDDCVYRRGTPAAIRSDGTLEGMLRAAYQHIAVVEDEIEQQHPDDLIRRDLRRAQDSVNLVGTEFDRARWLWSVKHTLRLERQLQALYNRPNCQIWRQYDAELNAALTSYETLLARALSYTKPPGQPSGFVHLVRRVYAARNRARLAYDAIQKAGGLAMRDVLIARNKADLADIVDGMSVVDAVFAEDDLFLVIDGVGPEGLATLRRIFPRQERPVHHLRPEHRPITLTAVAPQKKRKKFEKNRRQHQNKRRRRY